MNAWMISRAGELTPGGRPLEHATLPDPEPGGGEVRIKVSCCGVCHTELDEIEGRLPLPALPVVPGHQVVGVVDRTGPGVKERKAGDRVGVAWIYSACGDCAFCRAGQENLCPSFRGTGRDVHGGYAEFMTVPESYAYPLPDIFSDVEAAPLLCAGAVGYRSVRLSGIRDGETAGLTGFGASGHLTLQVIRHLYPRSTVMVFARKHEEREFALKLGAAWAGDTNDIPPEKCRVVIDTTPVWGTVVAALACLSPGGRLVINAIRKENSDREELTNLSFQDHLWMEREIKSVANVTRADVREFLQLAASIPLHPEIKTYPFSRANEALLDLKFKHVRGAKVLRVATSA